MSNTERNGQTKGKTGVFWKRTRKEWRSRKKHENYCNEILITEKIKNIVVITIHEKKCLPDTKNHSLDVAKKYVETYSLPNAVVAQNPKWTLHAKRNSLNFKYYQNK